MAVLHTCCLQLDWPQTFPAAGNRTLTPAEAAVPVFRSRRDEWLGQPGRYSTETDSQKHNLNRNFNMVCRVPKRQRTIACPTLMRIIKSRFARNNWNAHALAIAREGCQLRQPRCHLTSIRSQAGVSYSSMWHVLRFTRLWQRRAIEFTT